MDSRDSKWKRFYVLLASELTPRLKLRYDFIVRIFFSKIIKSNNHESNISIHSNLYVRVNREMIEEFCTSNFSIKSY